jgi:cell division inhibitor SepF
MASMWKRAMTYLGLGDDEDFIDHDREPEVEARRSPERRPARVPRDPRDQREEAPEVVLRGAGTVRPLPPQPRPAPSGPGSAGAGAGTGAVTARAPNARPTATMRPVPMPVTAKPHVIVPRSFNEAQEVADSFKGGAPVILNLQEGDRDLARRLIDFASGVCYGLGGSMERVANSVYLLTPADVEVSAEDKRRLEERGYSS